jgi:hypothetical protein
MFRERLHDVAIFRRNCTGPTAAEIDETRLEKHTRQRAIFSRFEQGEFLRVLNSTRIAVRFLSTNFDELVAEVLH